MVRIYWISFTKITLIWHICILLWERFQKPDSILLFVFSLLRSCVRAFVCYQTIERNHQFFMRWRVRRNELTSWRRWNRSSLWYADVQIVIHHWSLCTLSDLRAPPDHPRSIPGVTPKHPWNTPGVPLENTRRNTGVFPEHPWSTSGAPSEHFRSTPFHIEKRP